MLCEFLEEEPEGSRCCSVAGSFLPRILSVLKYKLHFPTTLTFPKRLILGQMKKKAAHLYGLAKLHKCGSVGLHGHRVRANDITVTLVNNSGDAVDLAVVQDCRNSTKKKTSSASMSLTYNKSVLCVMGSTLRVLMPHSAERLFETHQDECGDPSLTQGHKSQERGQRGAERLTLS